MQDRPTDWRLISLLYAVGLLAAAQFAKIALQFVTLGGVYPDRLLPWAVSALSLAGIVFGLTAGVFVARIGPRRALLGALAVAGAITLAEAALPPFPAFMALRLAEGLTHLVLVVAAPTLMAASAASRDVPVAMGLWGTFFGVGFALAAVVIPWLALPEWVFLAHALAFFAAAAALFPLLPRGAGRSEPGPGFLRRHAAIYRTPARVAPAVGFFFHTSIFLGLLTFVPLTVEAHIGALMPLVALIGTFGAGFLARRFRPRSILLAASLGIVATGLALVVLPEVWRVHGVLIFIAVVGVIPGASFANVPALNLDPAAQAQANGVIAQLGNVGTAISTPLFAAALGLGGFEALILLAAAVAAFGFGAVWLIHRKID